MMRPRYFHLSDKLNREKICRFVDKYVTKLYGLRQIRSWASNHKKMSIFDMITMSDIANTVAVIENGHELWDQVPNPATERPSSESTVEEGMRIIREAQEQSPKKKVPKFMKKAGKKKKYNVSGWTQEGIEFYTKVWDASWKTLLGENKDCMWEKLEAKWTDYVEEFGNNRYGKRKRTWDNTRFPQCPALPPMEIREVMLAGDDNYQPDCPWKSNSNGAGDDENPWVCNLGNRVSMGGESHGDGDEWDM
jgi:hypothetical protein